MRIELRGVGRDFGGVRALDDLSLDIAPGTIVAVVGTNGAGKTTFMRLLAGLLKPTRGALLYDGEPFTRARLDLRKRFMFVADAPLVLADTSIIAWIGTCLRLYAIDRPGVEQDVLRVLDGLDLTALAGMPLATMSRGQLYKAAAAALIAVDAELWLLDEPFASGIDPPAIALLGDEMRAAAERGHTVVFSTQLVDAAERLAHRALVLDGGRAAVLPDATGLDAALRRLREERP